MSQPEAVQVQAESRKPSPEVGAGPMIRLAPSGNWPSINLRELWEYRELLYFLIWRDIKVRYRQTVLGASWAIIQPLSSMLIFSVFFGRLAKVPSDGIPYPRSEERRVGKECRL